MNDFEDDFEDEQPDQSVNIGYTVPQLPDDHWSLQPSWLKYKVGLTEDADARAEVEDWKGHAYALAGMPATD